MKKIAVPLVFVWLGGTLAAIAAEKLPLNPHLEPLRPLLEKTWKGTFNDSKPDKPTVDVGRWERKLISVYYFTTAGFMSIGTLEFKDGKFVGHEDIKGDADGITEVRSVSELLPNGKFHLKAEYLKNGEWIPGREVTYEKSPESKITFR